MPDLCMKVLSEVVCAFEISVAHGKGDDKVDRENKIYKIFVKRGIEFLLNSIESSLFSINPVDFFLY